MAEIVHENKIRIVLILYATNSPSRSGMYEVNRV